VFSRHSAAMWRGRRTCAVQVARIYMLTCEIINQPFEGWNGTIPGRRPANETWLAIKFQKRADVRALDQPD
jgi:hypothetical protein